MEGFEWAFTDAMEDMATVATAAATVAATVFVVEDGSP